MQLPDKEGSSRPPVADLVPTTDVELPDGLQEVGVRELVGALRRQVEAQTEQLIAKDRQIEQLHVLLQQTTQSPSRRHWWRLWR